jgi:hypothetical protein
MHHISAEVMGTYEDGRRAETERVQQVTEADWLTSACDFKCAEPSKTRPPSSVVVICFGRWRAERERQRQQVTEADWFKRARDSTMPRSFKNTAVVAHASYFSIIGG